MSPSPFEALARALRDRELVCAGVLSGTSADGIDVVLCRAPGFVRETVGREERLVSRGRPEVLAFETLPFEPCLQGRLRRLLDEEGGEEARRSLRELALLSRDLGQAFGRAVLEVARDSGFGVGLVGSHGQTLYHHDGDEPSGAATLQLGDGDFVAQAVGAPVVSDFRQGDIAAGGEGAPLSALVEDELFPELPRPAAILNLGGIANLSLLGERGTPPLAFDTGPAGALLDGLARELLGQTMHRDGARAARGRPDAALVESLLAHPFFEREPPKSTGRETFGAHWLELFLRGARERGLGTSDVFASAVELVARSVALGLERFASPAPRRLVVCGGGVHNPALLEALERAAGIEVDSSADHGVSPDAREALGFALLAVRFVLALPSTSERTTGALSGRVLGKFCLSGPETSGFRPSTRSFS